MGYRTSAYFAALVCALDFAAAQIPQPPMPLRLVSTANSQKAGGAFCLDGSLPGYYFIPPQPGFETKWRLHFCGGGWCQTADSCLSRAQSSMGSSTFWPPFINQTGDAYWGFMDANTTYGFSGWGVIFIAYCDGTSYTSNMDAPMVVNNSTLYFRGRRVLDALMLEWEDQFSLLSTTTELIVSGTSAGGIATYLHAHEIAAALQVPSAHVVAMPDAGFFLNANDTAGVPAFANGFKGSVTPLWNATGSLPPACVARVGQAESWRCMFVAEFYADVAPFTPFFILNSMIDFAQITGILGLGCNPSQAGSCSALQMSQLQAYGEAQTAAIQAAVTARDGYFIPSCYQHELSCRDYDFSGITVDVAGTGVNMNASFHAWYYGTNAAPTRVVDVPFPGDATCVDPGVWHGTC